MNRRDRLVNTALFAAAAGTWIAFGLVVLNFSPVGEPQVLIAGALLLGGAVSLTLVPLLWLAGFARGRGIAYRGDWWRASRRGLLAGFVVALFVVLRGQDQLSLPIALFIVGMAALAEVTMSLRR